MSDESPETITMNGREYIRSEGMPEWVVKVDGRRVDGWEDSEVGRQAAMRASSLVPGSIVVLEKTPLYIPKDYKPDTPMLERYPPEPFPKKRWWEFWK